MAAFIVSSVSNSILVTGRLYPCYETREIKKATVAGPVEHEMQDRVTSNNRE